MPITFNFLIQKWKYEFYSSKIEIYNGKEYMPIIMADTEEKFIEDLKKYGYFEEWCNKISKTTLKEPNKTGQLTMEDYLWTK